MYQIHYISGIVFITTFATFPIFSCDYWVSSVRPRYINVSKYRYVIASCLLHNLQYIERFPCTWLYEYSSFGGNVSPIYCTTDVTKVIVDVEFIAFTTLSLT